MNEKFLNFPETETELDEKIKNFVKTSKIEEIDEKKNCIDYISFKIDIFNVKKRIEILENICREIIKGNYIWFSILMDHVNWGLYYDEPPLDSNFMLCHMKYFTLNNLCCKHINYQCKCIIPKLVFDSYNIKLNYDSNKDYELNLLSHIFNDTTKLSYEICENCANIYKLIPCVEDMNFRTPQNKNTYDRFYTNGKKSIRNPLKKLYMNIPKWIPQFGLNLTFFNEMKNLSNFLKEKEQENYWEQKYNITLKGELYTETENLKTPELIEDLKNTQRLTIYRLWENFQDKREKTITFLMCTRSFDSSSYFHEFFLPFDMFKLILNFSNFYWK